MPNAVRAGVVVLVTWSIITYSTKVLILKNTNVKFFFFLNEK